MNVKRLVTVLLIAVVISGTFTLWLSHQVKKAHPAAPVVATLQYAAATQSLEAGTVLRPDEMKMMPWPANDPLDGAHQKIDEIAGRAVLFPLAAGEPILDRQLAVAGQGGFTGKIPPGMRAIAVRSNEVVGVAGFLQPGTHVDVLVTYHTASSPDPVTSTILQDVEVLAAGQKFQPDADVKSDAANVVTLLVKPEDAEKIVLASSQGDLHFVLRNGLDRAQVQDSGVNVSEFKTGGTSPHPVVARAARPSASNGYTVHTIAGGKQSTESFQ
jgi:pilus assembly protein CpaB